MNNEITVKKDINSLLSSENTKKRFQEILGKKANGFISNILSISKSEKFKNVEGVSIINAAVLVAALDLSINQNLGHAYIIPYKNEAQFQLGYRGFVQLAIRSGQYKNINAEVIYEGELIAYDRVKGYVQYDCTKKTSNKVIGYVAYIELVNGFEKYLYMTKEEAEIHGRKYSKAYNYLWSSDFDAMAKKTVLKLLLSRWGILSIKMQKALIGDQATNIKFSNDDKDSDFTVEYGDNPSNDNVIDSTTKEKSKTQEEFESINQNTGEITNAVNKK